MREGAVKTRAFTLIEIMLVVVLLGILAAVVIPIYWDSQTSARIARAQSDISVLNRQLVLYNANGEKFRAKTNYIRAARMMARAGYIKDVAEAPDGFEYLFDEDLGKFSYTETGKIEKKGGKPKIQPNMIPS